MDRRCCSVTSPRSHPASPKLATSQASTPRQPAAHHSQSVLFPKFGPGRRDGLIVLYKVVHILFGYSIDVDAVPVTCENVHDVFSVLVCATAGEARVSFQHAWRRVQGRKVYITQAFSFALRNSEIVSTGKPATVITVEVSKRRGPSSPAGSISIYGSNVGSCAKEVSRTTYVDRGYQAVVGCMHSGSM